MYIADNIIIVEDIQENNLTDMGRSPEIPQFPILFLNSTK